MNTFKWTAEYVGDVLPLAKGFHYLNLLNASHRGDDDAPSGYAVEEILAAAANA